MPRSTSFDRVSRPGAMMACHALHRPTMSASPKAILYATPDIVQPCLPVQLFVLPKGDDRIPHLTSINRVCFPKAVMACRARRCSTVCAIQRR